jgi:hypothetical protein
MAGHVDRAERDVVQGELEGLFPWASDDALVNATALVTEQLDKFDEQPVYTMERLASARAAGEKLAALVGPMPIIAERPAATGKIMLITDTFAHAAARMQRVLSWSPRGVLRMSGDDERPRHAR